MPFLNAIRHVRPCKKERKASGHGCSKNDSLIWNKLRAQLHGSVHPTHSVTLMGGGEQENQPVRSQSARPKKQERLKKKPWNAKPKPTGGDLQMPRAPTLLTQATAGTRRSLLHPRGSPTASPTSPTTQLSSLLSLQGPPGEVGQEVAGFGRSGEAPVAVSTRTMAVLKRFQTKVGFENAESRSDFSLHICRIKPVKSECC